MRSVVSAMMGTANQVAATSADNLHSPWAAHDTRLLVVAAIGIALIVVLIVWLKVHAFLALTIGSLVVGIFSGTGDVGITKSYENGVGGVLGYVGVLIALGAMLGKLLADSGGADRIVDTLLKGRPLALPWKMALIAAIIGIPMFFEIGLVLLIPVVMLAVRHSGMKAMLLGIPALAGLSVLHGFIPPHPGPLAAIGALHANVGITLALGLVVAIPCVVVAGPVFARFAARWVPIGAAGAALAVTGGMAGGAAAVTGGAGAAGSSPTESASTGSASGAGGGASGSMGSGSGDPARTGTPSFGWTLTTVLSPVVLMLLGAAADIWIPKDSWVYSVLTFIGDPVVALLIAVLLSMMTFGTAVGFSLGILGSKLTESLKPIVSVLLIVGAGGGFKQVLVDGGTGNAIAKLAIAANLSVLVMGWLVAVLIRLATGSATVATVTAAGIVSELAVGLSPAHLALVVLAVGAGSLFFSHVNDAGFWLVKEYFGLSVGQTIKTWSLMETIISVLGFLVVGLLWIII